MKPTIGRIVTFKLADPNVSYPDLTRQNGGETELPAVIVRVWSDTCVNLKVFTDGPYDIWVTSASQGDGPRNWNWPKRVE